MVDAHSGGPRGQWELVSGPETSSAGGGGRVFDRQQMHTAGSREALQSRGNTEIRD